ncbi:hypothetical protein [Cerasicoccus frondis]|uniref:hypothetical protein n=1 Tax=Cerasicoccus frondis TaxID=490090 RepID=UPI0028529B31|nr:hypothetical protein [Cerasicoccus frondis]
MDTKATTRKPSFALTDYTSAIFALGLIIGVPVAAGWILLKLIADAFNSIG